MCVSVCMASEDRGILHPDGEDQTIRPHFRLDAIERDELQATVYYNDPAHPGLLGIRYSFVDAHLTSYHHLQFVPKVRLV